jgi:3-methyl-2-oxobutanoate hydroxymethyltransferase
MKAHRRTVADMLSLKGKRPITMLKVDTPEEARAADEAGIDMLSIHAEDWSPAMRGAAGRCFVQVVLLYGVHCTGEDYLRAAHRAIAVGGDCVYCCPGLKTIELLAGEGIPVVGHVGLIPARATWTGGFRAVGKTADTARLVYRQVKDLEAAGAFASEIEVVPERVAAAISARTPLLLLSMGAGAGCDAQYLFAEDVLGCTRGHMPRHAKSYRNFRAEFERLQAERVNAFREFAEDVHAFRYPADDHKVPIPDAEFEEFMRSIA